MGKNKIIFNKTFTYVFPLLEDYFSVLKGDIIAIFIGDDDKPEYDNHIFILLDWDNNFNTVRYEAYLEQNNLFVDKYDPSTDTVMLIFKVPKKYQGIYDLYKEGKYSKFPEKYKEKILRFHNIFTSKHKVYQVLYKDERLYQELEDKLDVRLNRSVEISSIPDLELEVFNKKILNHYENNKKSER